MAGGEHSGVVIERFESRGDYFSEIGMLRVEQPVVFFGSEGRRNKQNTTVGFLRESVSDASEFRGRRGAAPNGWKVGEGENFSGEIVGDFGDGEK